MHLFLAHLRYLDLHIRKTHGEISEHSPKEVRVIAMVQVPAGVAKQEAEAIDNLVCDLHRYVCKTKIADL